MAYIIKAHSLNCIVATILPRQDTDSWDQTGQNTKFNKEITTEVLPAGRELTAQ